MYLVVCELGYLEPQPQEWHDDLRSIDAAIKCEYLESVPS
jgi:hypothetical protein